MSKADRMRGVEVVRKPSRRRPAVLSMDEAAIREQARRSMGGLPSLSPPAEVLPPEPRTAAEFGAAIRAEWETAQSRLLRVGSLLDAAETSLSRPDYMSLVDALPFGKAARSQLLTAYRAIRSGRVPETIAPAGYTTVYLLASMSDDERMAAEQAGLMRADVSRAEVTAFRRERSSGLNTAPDRSALLAKRRKLLGELLAVRRALQGH